MSRKGATLAVVLTLAVVGCHTRHPDPAPISAQGPHLRLRLKWRTWPDMKFVTESDPYGGIRSGTKDTLVKAGDRIPLDPLLERDGQGFLEVLSVTDTVLELRTSKRVFYASPGDTVPVDPQGIRLGSHTQDAGCALDLSVVRVLLKRPR